MSSVRLGYTKRYILKFFNLPECSGGFRSRSEPVGKLSWFIFRDFPQSLQTISGEIRIIWRRPCHSTYFLICYSLLSSKSAVLIGHNPRNPPTWPRYFLLHSLQYPQKPNSLTLKMEPALYIYRRKNDYNLNDRITQKFVILIYHPTIHLWPVLGRPLPFLLLIITYSMD